MLRISVKLAVPVIAPLGQGPGFLQKGLQNSKGKKKESRSIGSDINLSYFERSVTLWSELVMQMFFDHSDNEVKMIPQYAPIAMLLNDFFKVIVASCILIIRTQYLRNLDPQVQCE